METQLEYNIEGSVTDVDWNSKYHMVAITAFGKSFPIVLFFWEK